jgi:hypothetical protein
MELHFGSERVVVWGDVTREARLKAPEMNAKMLKAQKNMSSPPPPFTLRHTLISHLPRSTGNGCRITGVRKTPNLPSNLAGSVKSQRKKELLKKIQDETGAKPGEPEMMNYYVKYLAR